MIIQKRNKENHQTVMSLSLLSLSLLRFLHSNLSHLPYINTSLFYVILSFSTIYAKDYRVYIYIYIYIYWLIKKIMNLQEKNAIFIDMISKAKFEKFYVNQC